MAFILVAIIAILDHLTYPAAFYAYSIVLGLVASIMYYLFKKDLSETVAIFAAFFIMLMFGLEDLIFYIISGGLPADMPHLAQHWVIGTVSTYLGYTTVVPASLFISVVLGFALSIVTINWLKKQRW